VQGLVEMAETEIMEAEEQAEFPEFLMEERAEVVVPLDLEAEEEEEAITVAVVVVVVVH